MIEQAAEQVYTARRSTTLGPVLPAQHISDEYTLETGGDSTKVTTSNICDFINERYTGKYPLLEALRGASVEISGPRGVVSAKLPAGEVAVELAYMLIKVIRASGSCAEVLVKDYADGQMTEWT